MKKERKAEISIDNERLNRELVVSLLTQMPHDEKLIALQVWNGKLYFGTERNIYSVKV